MWRYGWIWIISVFYTTKAAAQQAILNPGLLWPAGRVSLSFSTDARASLFSGSSPGQYLPYNSILLPAKVAEAVPANQMAPDACYRQHFGFFCKQEWVWQKRTGVPVKIRLGNYSYAQQQEGKH
ncbi:hypothetical protein ACDQ55_03625 [Chitinophaga sp. 30R24]|uniref:hypothetical protein n=1 Tax=Chitinophaga sp. 30R24 TaxID=3248838 RepID=UPI003B8FF36D